MASIPTVEINRGGHRCIINESDYDPARDTLWGEAKKTAPTLLPTYEPPVDPIPPAKPGLLPSVPSIEARLAELQELAKNWRKIKPVAESAGITEVPEDGWDAAVLPILVAEYGQAAVDDLDE